MTAIPFLLTDPLPDQPVECNSCSWLNTQAALPPFTSGFCCPRMTPGILTLNMAHQFWRATFIWYTLHVEQSPPTQSVVKTKRRPPLRALRPCSTVTLRRIAQVQLFGHCTIPTCSLHAHCYTLHGNNCSQSALEGQCSFESQTTD